jgi:hypothetical protein
MSENYPLSNVQDALSNKTLRNEWIILVVLIAIYYYYATDVNNSSIVLMTNVERRGLYLTLPVM